MTKGVLPDGYTGALPSWDSERMTVKCSPGKTER